MYAYVYIYIDSTCQMPESELCFAENSCKCSFFYYFIPWIDELIFFLRLLGCWGMTENDVFYNCFHSLDFFLWNSNNVLLPVKVMNAWYKIFLIEFPFIEMATRIQNINLRLVLSPRIILGWERGHECSIFICLCVSILLLKNI